MSKTSSQSPSWHLTNSSKSKDVHFTIIDLVFTNTNLKKGWLLNVSRVCLMFNFSPCVVVAAEPRRRPPSWEDQGQQSLHPAGHYPGARLPHHQSGHRGRQVRLQVYSLNLSILVTPPIQCSSSYHSSTSSSFSFSLHYFHSCELVVNM